MTDCNPYAAPRDLDELPSPEFRSNWLARAFLRLIRGREKAARFHEKSGEYEMFQAVWLLGLSPLLTFVVPTIWMISILVFAPWQIMWGIGGAIVIIFLGLVLRVTQESVCFTDKYIRKFGPFRRKSMIPWEEVHVVQLGPGAEIVFRGNQERCISVCSDLHGHADLFSMMNRCLSRDAMKISNSSLRELARHFHCNTAEFSSYLDRPPSIHAENKS